MRVLRASIIELVKVILLACGAVLVLIGMALDRGAKEEAVNQVLADCHYSGLRYQGLPVYHADGTIVRCK